jgi:hypothetical protein
MVRDLDAKNALLAACGTVHSSPYNQLPFATNLSHNALLAACSTVRMLDNQLSFEKRFWESRLLLGVKPACV